MISENLDETRTEEFLNKVEEINSPKSQTNGVGAEKQPDDVDLKKQQISEKKQELEQQIKPISDSSSDVIPEDNNFETEMLRNQPTQPGAVRNDDDPSPQMTPPKTKDRNVSVVSADEFEMAQKKTEPKINEMRQSDVNISDDFSNNIDVDDIGNDDISKLNDDSLIDKLYDSANGDDIDDKNVVVVTETSSKTESPVITETRKKPNYYGGDGETTAFKIRNSKVSKIVGKINISDTTKVDPTDIGKKSMKEQQSIFIDTILPTLKPSFSIVPCIVSGVVISMTAFNWPDIREICLIDEEINDLDPYDPEYKYLKNQVFLKKRRKQLEIFYNHIYSVSGFADKPDIDTLFRKIILFPDFPQLFFAAYAASFPKPYDLELTCSTCGATNPRSIPPKKLCFLLNKNINIDQLNSILIKGSTIANTNDSINVYNEFQNIELVKQCRNTYVAKKPLPSTSMIFNYKMPTIYDALDTLDEIIEKFKDVELEKILDTGETVAIDYNFNLTKEMMTIKSYLYVSSILAAKPTNTDGDDITVGYIKFTGPEFIISTIRSLMASDYKTFISDANLNKLIRISGIRHGIAGGNCDSELCKTDLGITTVEIETLFFMIGKDELSD